jgi:hypothetical protein
MLCKNLHVQLEVVKTLNPATLLSVNSRPLERDCLEIMDEVFSSQPGLTNQLIISPTSTHPDIEYFMDGQSFVSNLGEKVLNMDKKF